ncbi:MAG: ribulose-phosphate 3-epimerase [Bdellovibrionaceae bacterium]|nr:ribulose-phosphate 3-epimerase [Pseudobdellovibrionaceae bacterium]|tara:strand:- start:713 stop:1381 length:669 start_codon:yes stop_codon:yes gene_type:complete
MKDFTKFNFPIAPSLLSADFSNLSSEIKEVEKYGVNWIHVDVMDGHFVPNITIGPVVVQSLRLITSSLLDCHLMVSHPKQWVEAFVKAGADLITIHVESEDDVQETINLIHHNNCAAGISINPGTPISKILPYLDSVETVLVMSVQPGFGGQSFKEEVLEKVTLLKEKQSDYSYLIQIDGGISEDTIKKASLAGVDVFVAGSAVFSKKDRESAIKNLKERVK